jgi:hypothetical protein
VQGLAARAGRVDERRELHHLRVRAAQPLQRVAERCARPQQRRERRARRGRGERHAHVPAAHRQPPLVERRENLGEESRPLALPGRLRGVPLCQDCAAQRARLPRRERARHPPQPLLAHGRHEHRWVRARRARGRARGVALQQRLLLRDLNQVVLLI